MSARVIALVVVVLGLGVGAGVLIAGGDDGDKDEKGAQATSQTESTIAPAPPPPAFNPGEKFSEPPAVFSKDGKLRATLMAKDGIVTVSGVKVDGTQTYAVDGVGTRGFLGPTLHVNPGERVELTLDNRLRIPPGSKAPNCPEAGMGHHGGHATQGKPGDRQLTNLHFHGLHVTPREVSPYGDTVLVHLKNGKSRFSFKIPADHDKGTFWYHAHLHTCTDDQVSRGLAGLLLIGDSRRDLPKPFHRIQTRSLALKDIQVVPSKGRAPWQIDPGHTWTKATHRTVNGHVNPKMTIRPNETQLWRLANVSAGVWYQVALVDPADDESRDRFTVVAQDGNSLRRPTEQTTVLIPPGARYDILVRGPESGSRALKTLPFNQGFIVFGEDTLATVDVTGPPATALAPPKKLVAPTQKFPTRRGPTRRFVFDIDLRATETDLPPPSSTSPFALVINSSKFDEKSPDATPYLNTTERWILENKSEEWHPFHIHQDDFRIVSTSKGAPPSLPGDHDIVPLPPGTPVKPSRTVIEMPFTDYDGKFVFHCHILDHEDGGMMALVDLRRSPR
jgi:FtsP/CotA-like multicopper oxidase with cupredoxin domain